MRQKNNHIYSIIAFKRYKATLTMLLTACLLLLSHIVEAQINTNKIRVDLSSVNFKACSDANNGLTTVTIQSKQATTTNFRISFDLPDGINYQPGSAAIISQSGSGDFILNEIDISNLNSPVFGIQRPSNAPWQINDIVSFTYEKIADCDAVQYSYNGGLFKDAHSVTFTDSDGVQNYSDTDMRVSSYNIYRAFLAIDDIPAISGNIGETKTRNIVLRNSGNGSIENFDYQVEVPMELQSGYTLSFNGTLLVPTDITGNFFTYAVNLNSAPFLGQVGNGNNLFENESITFQESITISSCNQNLNTKHSPRWGCNPGNYCQIGTAITGQVWPIEEYADLSFDGINHTSPRWDAPVTYTNRVTNNSSTITAYNVKFNVGYSWDEGASTEGYNRLYGDDKSNNRLLSNFRFAGGPSYTPNRWVNSNDPSTGMGSYLTPENFFTSDPDGPGTGLEDLDGDGYFDDLAPGQSTDLLVDLTLLPSTPGCSEWSSYFLNNEHLRMETWSINQCNNATATQSISSVSSLVYAPSLFNWTNPKDFDPDATEGSVFHLNFVGRLDANYEEPTCNGIPMLGNDPSTVYRAVINVPNGVTLDSSADGRYTQSGTTITFLESNLGDFAYNDYSLRIPIDFPLNLDCTLYTGPELLDIPYTTYYDSSCFDREIHCGSFTFRTHCNDTCNGPTTTSFEANRATAGWTDNTMATKVNLDPNVHNTKYYMAKDEMVVTTSAIMENDVRDNLFFEMQYVTDGNVDMADIIAFTSGTITINDVSSGGPLTTTINVSPNVITYGSNDNRMIFDLSSYRSLIAPGYQYGEGFDPDEISLELHFYFKENFPEKNRLYQFYTFTGKFYSRDSSNNKVGCDVYEDRAFFFENTVRLLSGTNEYITGCDVGYLYLNIEQSSGLSDKFPNEFRPTALLKSATIQIPDGMVFENFVGSYAYPDMQPSGQPPHSDNGGLSYTVSGNMVTITPGPGFLHLDQNGNRYPELNIWTRATSAVAESSSFQVSAIYDDYAYADVPVERNETGFNILNAIHEQFNLQVDNPVVIGNSELASFTVKVSDGAVRQIDNNWLRVDPGTGFTLTEAVLVDAGMETPLNVVEEAGIYYIQFGVMEGWVDTVKTITFRGTFTECNTQTIKVSQNYDCIAYPSSYSSLPYFNEKELILEPVPAAVQLDILSQPLGTVDTCTDYTVVLEVRNAGEGDLLSPTVYFDIPGDLTSLNITDIAVEYPRNSGNTESLTPAINGNTVTLNLLEHSFIATEKGISGSYGASSLEDQIAIITMVLNPQCNYRSNTGTTYEVRGNNPCGTPAVGSGSRLASEPIVLTGAEPAYSTNTIIISSPTIAGCASETVSVETYIVDGITGTSDYTRIVLPQGMAYVPGSFVSTGNVSASFGAVSMVGNQEEVIINLPSGASTSDKIAYSLAIESTPFICEGAYPLQLTTYVTTTGLSCGGTSCGTTEIFTGEASTQINVTKGILAPSSYVPSATYAQSSSNTYYSMSIGLENTGSEDLPVGMEYSVYCSDGSGNISGSAIYTGALAQGITAGTAIIENIAFNSATFCGASSELVVQFQPGNGNCFCQELAIVVPTTAATGMADLSLVKEVSNRIPQIGETLTFTISLYNNGPSVATGVQVQDILPNGFVLDPASITNGGVASGNVITWNLPSVPVGSTDLTYQVTVNAPTGTAGEYVNIAQVTASDQNDPDSTPNNDDGDHSEDDEDAVDDISVNGEADLSLLKSVSNTAPDPGNTVVFTLTLANSGPADATNIQIQDELPSGFTLDPTSISNGGIISGNTITWSLATLPMGTLDITYQVMVNEPTGIPGEYKNIAQVIAVDQTDPDSMPNNDDGDQSEDDEDANEIMGITGFEYEITLFCGEEVPPVVQPEFTGGCGGNTVTFQETTNAIQDSNDYTIIRTWNVTDSCGTTRIYEQNIYILQPVSEEIAIEVCIEDGPLDLLNYVPQQYATGSGTFEIISGDVTLNGSILDPEDLSPGEYQIKYTSSNNTCYYYADFTITATASCVTCAVGKLQISKAVTANNDGVNDLFTITQSDWCDKTFNLLIFNRWGNKVFEAIDYKNDWGGIAPKNAIGGSGNLPTGTYYYMITVIGDNNETLNGYFYLGTD